MSYHSEQFTSLLKHELANFLDRTVERQEGTLFSVTRVALDHTGERAEAFISIYPDEHATTIFRSLRSYQIEAREFLKDRVGRRKLPKIIFVHDTLAAHVRLEKLLENIKNE